MTRRPLSVPDPSWRIIQHLLLHFIFIWPSHLISLHQHGFYPGRGCSSAWQQILSEVLTSEHIEEFDMRNIFYTVNLDYLSRFLLSVHTPRELVDSIIRWYRTPAQSGSELPHQNWKNEDHHLQSYHFHVTGEWIRTLTEEQR